MTIKQAREILGEETFRRSNEECAKDVDRLKDRMRVFAGFIIDRIISEDMVREKRERLDSE